MGFIKKSIVTKLKKNKYSNPLNDNLESGNSIHIYGTMQGVTEKIQVQSKIDKTIRKFQIFLQESNDVFAILDIDGTIKYISNSVEKITGYKPEEKINKSIYEFYEGEELKKIRKMMEVMQRGFNTKIKGDVVPKLKSNKKIYLEINMHNLLHDPEIEGIIVYYKDITKRIEMEKRIAHIATHDELTGLPNNIYFKKKLKIECQQAKKAQSKFALMMLEIGGIRYINYSLGFEYGQRIIKEVVERLRTLDSSIFISHNAERNFALIVKGEKPYEEYKRIAQELIQLISEPYKVDKYELDIWVNIGISIYGDDVDDADSLSKKSKVALLRSKKDGKNRYDFHSSDMDIQNYKEFVLRSDLHHAIEKGQLRVNYQPIVNLKTNEIMAAEALIRWEHPDWGIVPPEEFIPLAEDTSYIVDIGHWMLREVCKNYREWMDHNLPNIKVSVNFSSVQFLEKNFVEKIKSIIDEFELDPHFLIIEITESIIMKKADKISLDIEKLKSYGIQIALDDFGTGFSSLTYLKDFNIDLLKIDGSFIKDIKEDKINAVITKYIINMAKELELKLVAEKIEDWDQLSFLRELNCCTGQGYLYSKPFPLDEFKEILRLKKCKPNVINTTPVIPRVNRREFFRIDFNQFLEAKLTVNEINGRKVAVGSRMVLIKNIGPGGLCMISDVRFPVKRYIALQFATELLETEIKVYGNPVWSKEIENNLYEYGVEFTMDENDRMDLIRLLNQVQIKMRNNIMFAEGSFIAGSSKMYFNWGH